MNVLVVIADQTVRLAVLQAYLSGDNNTMFPAVLSDLPGMIEANGLIHLAVLELSENTRDIPQRMLRDTRIERLLLFGRWRDESTKSGILLNPKVRWMSDQDIRRVLAQHALKSNVEESFREQPSAP